MGLSGWRWIPGECTQPQFVVICAVLENMTYFVSVDTRGSFAIKICRSEIRHESEEEAILLGRLMTGPASHPGKKHIVQLLDRFEITGPNGRHLCLIAEALGPAFDLDVLSPNAAWEVVRQMVEGISYVHDMGITHGGAWMGTSCYASV